MRKEDKIFEGRAKAQEFCLSSMKERDDVHRAIRLGLKKEHFEPIYQPLFDLIVAQSAEPGDNSSVWGGILAKSIASGDSLAFKTWNLINIDNLTYGSLSLKQYVEAVITCARVENALKALRATEETLSCGNPTSWQEAAAEMSTLSGKLTNIAHDQSTEPTLHDLAEEICAEIDDPTRAKRTPLHLGTLDREFTSLESHELIVLAGRPGTGKTALAVQLAWEQAKRGINVAFFSLEMSGKELIKRVALNNSGRWCFDGPPAMKDAVRTVGKNKALRIYADHGATSLPYVESTAIALSNAPGGLGLVVIDYLQLMDVLSEAKQSNREQQIAQLSRRLKLLPKRCKCPILVLAQLNRGPEREDRAPRVSDLRESGALEQDADRVWLLSEDESRNVIMEQGKCRNAPAHIRAMLQFDRPIYRFTQIAQE